MNAIESTTDFLDLSKHLLDILGPDGMGSEYEQREYAVNGKEPRWVLLPATEEECSAVLALCSQHGLGVIPAGFGARLQQGNAPARLDVVLSLGRMNRVVDHASGDLTLTVEAGASLASVNAVLAASGQWLPFDPPFSARTSIGGLVAAQASGPCRQRFGTVRESVIGIRAVLPGGTKVKSGGRVVKNVAGYDLQKLLAGSFGTLAVIVETSLKVQPLPEETAVVAFTAEGPTPLFALASGVASSNVEPLFLELFAGARVPVLAVGLAGVVDEVAEARERVRAMAADIPAGLAESESFPEEAIAAEIDGICRDGADALVLRAGVRPSWLGAWFSEALEACRGASSRVVAHAHAGLGIVRLRLEKPDRDRARAIVEELRRSSIRREGYLVIESGPWGDLDVWGPISAGIELMKGVKAAFDPREILSPGRFVGGI